MKNLVQETLVSLDTQSGTERTLRYLPLPHNTQDEDRDNLSSVKHFLETLQTSKQVSMPQEAKDQLGKIITSVGRIGDRIKALPTNMGKTSFR